jgi:hypothetical protein
MAKLVRLIASQLCSVNQLLLSNEAPAIQPHFQAMAGIRLDARSIVNLVNLGTVVKVMKRTHISKQHYRSTNLETENRKCKPPQFMVAIASPVISSWPGSSTFPESSP